MYLARRHEKRDEVDKSRSPTRSPSRSHSEPPTLIRQPFQKPGSELNLKEGGMNKCWGVSIPRLFIFSTINSIPPWCCIVYDWSDGQGNAWREGNVNLFNLPRLIMWLDVIYTYGR